MHPWFHGLDWDNLRSKPAPYVPKGCRKIRELMAELRTTDRNSPRFQAVVKSITANFDEFKETANPGAGNSPMAGNNNAGPSKMNINTAPPMAGQAAAGIDLGVGSPMLRKDKDDAFLGYTYKRKTVPSCVMRSNLYLLL